MPKLISLSGLTGTGKTTLALAMAKQTRAVYLHVDEIENVIKSSIAAIRSAEDASYYAAQVVAETNLKLGRSVIVDAMNPVARTRDWWVQSAARCNARFFAVALECSDLSQHRRRIETGRQQTTWDDVLCRRFEPYQDAHLRIDTSKLTPEACLLRVLKSLKDQDRKLLKGI